MTKRTNFWFAVYGNRRQIHERYNWFTQDLATFLIIVKIVPLVLKSSYCFRWTWYLNIFLIFRPFIVSNSGASKSAWRVPLEYWKQIITSFNHRRTERTTGAPWELISPWISVSEDTSQATEGMQSQWKAVSYPARSALSGSVLAKW